MIFSLIAWIQVASAFQVVTTLPELSWAGRGIVKAAQLPAGSESFEFTPLLKGTEDPHFVDAHPSYILKTSAADALCHVGLELEIGWLPKVLDRAANAKLERTGTGFCDASVGVHVLEKPQGSVDRSMGDVHAFGNPHYWLSPIALVDAAQAVRDLLIRNRPGLATEWTRGYDAFKTQTLARFSALKKRLQSQGGGSSVRVLAIEFHKEFTYFFDAYGISSMGSLEEIPGLPPSAARIALVAQEAKRRGARFILSTPMHPKNTTQRFSELSGAPVISLPSMIRPDQDYFELQELLVSAMVKAIHGAQAEPKS